MEKRKNSMLICPDPVAIAPSGAGDAGGLMPGAIHGAVGESMKKESSIDFPKSNGLCPEIWDDVDGSFRIKEDIKQKALELVDVLLARYHVEAKGVNVVGSICSNQYTEDADIDVHIQVDLPDDVTEKLNNLRKKETDSIFKDVDLMVGDSHTHPLEFYFQSNIYGDMGSCGCYDLMNDTWMVEPQIVDLEFDPYSEYEQSFYEASEFGKRTQDVLFELRKNLYKYTMILDQATYEDVYKDDQLMAVIYRRLEQVSEDIKRYMHDIADLKEEMVQVRRRAGIVPRNEEEAENMRTNKEWLTANSTFKFLQRLDVLDSVWLAAELYKAVENGDIPIEDAILEMNKQ